MAKYLDAETELAPALEEAQALGNQPTARLCLLFRRIAEHLICAPHFNRYPWALKEDMQSYALEKMIKNIKNYKQQYRDKCFAYFTRVAETAFIYQLKKHYKQLNIQRQLTIDAAEKLKSLNPVLAQQIIDNATEAYQ